MNQRVKLITGYCTVIYLYDSSVLNCGSRMPSTFSPRSCLAHLSEFLLVVTSVVFLQVTEGKVSQWTGRDGSPVTLITWRSCCIDNMKVKHSVLFAKTKIRCHQIPSKIWDHQQEILPVCHTTSFNTHSL